MVCWIDSLPHEPKASGSINFRRTPVWMKWYQCANSTLTLLMIFTFAFYFVNMYVLIIFTLPNLSLTSTEDKHCYFDDAYSKKTRILPFIISATTDVSKKLHFCKGFIFSIDIEIKQTFHFIVVFIFYHGLFLTPRIFKQSVKLINWQFGVPTGFYLWNLQTLIIQITDITKSYVWN